METHIASMTNQKKIPSEFREGFFVGIGFLAIRSKENRI